MNAPLRRGACPGLSAPMRTGDGLLVRLLPIGTMPLAAFAALCAAARRHGNGVIEITARGSIQVRGLTLASAPRFAAEISALGIAAESGVPVHTNPLAGLDAEEIFDPGELAAELRYALARSNLTARLAPKVSVAIDGGGELGLDALSADVRLRAERINDRVALRTKVGGESAGDIGLVAPADAVACAIRLLEVIARSGRDVRARDIIASDGPAPFGSAVADLLLCVNSAPSADRAAKNRELIGAHRLGDGSVAFGLSLAFGHADARSLENLIEAAATMRARGVRTVPGRALIVIGLVEEAVTGFTAAAERLGFIVRADDPRRSIVACAGAPFCASAHIAARAMAPRIAASARRFLDESFTIHISGCAKGCARAAPAALTIVGRPDGCALIADGTPREAPFAVVAADQLPDAVTRCARANWHEADHV